jgi:hypothetical protein
VGRKSPAFDRGLKVGDETLRAYSLTHFYLVKLGEILDKRYGILGKLGYATSSTLWLSRGDKFDTAANTVTVNATSTRAAVWQRELNL